MIIIEIFQKIIAIAVQYKYIEIGGLPVEMEWKFNIILND